MSSTLRNFALGRGVGALTITPQTPNSTTGVLSAGTASSILGQFKTWKPTQSNTLEEISPTSSKARNNMILDSGVKLTVTGILFANDSAASSTNPAVPLVNSYDYLAVACTRGGMSVTVYGLVEEYEEEVKDKGSVTFSLTLGEIDIQSANPVYV
jgi:hypothetical protein